MLREAAGVRLDLSTISPPANVTDLLHQQAQSSVLTRRYPGLEVSHVGNTEALKELAVAYDLGGLAAAIAKHISSCCLGPDCPLGGDLRCSASETPAPGLFLAAESISTL